MVFPSISVVKLAHAHESYPGFSLRTPGFNSYKGLAEKRVKGLDYGEFNLVPRAFPLVIWNVPNHQAKSPGNEVVGSCAIRCGR